MIKIKGRLKKEEDRPLIAYANKCRTCGGRTFFAAVDFPGNLDILCENCSFEGGV